MDETELQLAAAIDAWLDAKPAPAGRAEESAALRGFLLRLRPGARQAIGLRLWREAEGWRDRAMVAVWGGRSTAAIDMARRRFGEAAVLTSVGEPDDALKQVGGHGVAVLALSGDRQWWGRLLARPGVKVFAALPELSSGGPVLALAVGEGATGPSGQDETWWVTDAAGSSQTVEDALSALGLAARLQDRGGGLSLFSIAGYVQEDDARLRDAPGQLTGVIGWSPLPFDL